MIKKNQSLNNVISQDMAGRAIGQPTTTTEVTNEVTNVLHNTTNVIQKHTKGYKNNIVSIRFDEGDYEKLQVIAQEQGTNAASLIRKAVKDIIKLKTTE